MNQRINATELHPPPGYSHVAVAAGRSVHAAGAVPLDENGRVVGDGDRAAQARQVLDNLRMQLAAAGAGPPDVVKTTVYVVATTMEQLDEVWDVFMASDFAGAPSTLLGVTVLGYPGQLVEVEATAVID
jgi:enamine deaminase RidA (YjgF/YER057c/UK114 family)